MAINSVTSLGAQPSPQIQQAPRQFPVQQTNDADDKSAATKAQRQTPAEPPRPVVNTQGQKTGQLINTTA